MSDPAQSSRNDSGRPKRRRSTSRWPRGPELTDRDVEIVRWITRHGVVTADLVGRRFFWRQDQHTYGQWAAYRRLAALSRLDLVLRDKPFANQPAAIRVTREGARIADVGLRPAPLVLSQLRHSLAVVKLTEGLLYYHPKAELTTERELRAERYRELRDGTRHTESGRAPDALLRIPAAGRDDAKRDKTVAVELDLSRKDRRAMERLIRQYDRENVDQVWWFVIPVRFERTRQLVRELRATDRIEVFEWRG